MKLCESTADYHLERGIMKKFGRRLCLAVAVPAAALLLGSCVTLPFQSSTFELAGFSFAGGSAPADRGATASGGGQGGASAPAPVLAAMTTLPGQKLLPVQKRLLAGAEHFLGKRELVYDGRTYTFDCTGTVLAIYAYAGINLLPMFDRQSGDGVKRLYKIMRDHDLLTKSKHPQPGDLVFWDNTYDENGDGRWDDPLTHVGMVVGVTESGEISYIHQRYDRGIVIQRMSLVHPDTYTEIEGGTKIVVNSPMRQIDQPPGPLWLAGQLFDSFGRGYLLASQ